MAESGGRVGWKGSYREGAATAEGSPRAGGSNEELSTEKEARENDIGERPARGEDGRRRVTCDVGGGACSTLERKRLLERRS